MHPALAPLLLALAPQAAPELYPDALQQDLFLLTEKLTTLHAGLHRYAAPAEIERVFDSAARAIADRPRTKLWFYREVSGLLAAIRCGHTRVRLAERDRSDALARRGLLPLELLLDGNRAWIRRVLVESSELRPGQELLSIDGAEIAAIRERACARLSGDGFIETGKKRELERDFAELYVLLVDERESGEYELLLAGATEPVRLPGLTPAEYATRRGPSEDRPLFRLELFPAEHCAYLAIAEFGDAPGEPSFPEQLESSFRSLRDHEVRRLVLDLRGNGGGRDAYGALLVSYLASEPFGYFERIEVTPEYSGDVEIVERDGRRLMLSHPGLAVQQPAASRFDGEVRILVDGFTFSTAADVASVAHANRLARFYGEETGGGYQGNNSGDSERLTLPNSALTVNVPAWNYTTAGVAPGHEGRGVVPDVELSADIEDALAARDAVLARALRDGGPR